MVTRKKLPAKLPELVPQPHGGALYRGGVPGHDGSKTGRPPDEFKRMMAALASDDDTIKALREILADKSHPQYMQALKFAAERGYGVPTQNVDLNGGRSDHTALRPGVQPGRGGHARTAAHSVSRASMSTTGLERRFRPGPRP